MICKETELYSTYLNTNWSVVQRANLGTFLGKGYGLSQSGTDHSQDYVR